MGRLYMALKFMKKEIKVEKIELNIGDQKIELTFKEMEELYSILGNILNKKVYPQMVVDEY